MRRPALFFLFVFFSFHTFVQGQIESKNDSTISWSESQKVEWKDFVGKLNPNVFAYAVTSHKIDITPENVVVDSDDNIVNYQDLNVVANFYKKQSWTISDDLNLLHHERLHFDIAELFARKIRKRFSQLKSLNEKRFSKYWNEYNILWKECRTFQKKYDLETNHGAKKNENDKWVNTVTILLHGLKAFAYKI